MCDEEAVRVVVTEGTERVRELIELGANFDKNKTVLSAKDLDALRDKIGGEENQLRSEQMNYQQDLMAAQNNAMNGFLKTLKASVSVVAAQKKLTLVLPENTLLYSAPGADITDAVLTNLQGK